EKCQSAVQAGASARARQRGPQDARCLRRRAVLASPATSRYDGARAWARSSAEEHYLDMVGVTGSIPVAPTTHSRFLPTCGDAPKMPTNGGLFQCVLFVSRSPGGQPADFGAQSVRRKIAFLAPKSCGDESFALEAVGGGRALGLKSVNVKRIRSGPESRSWRRKAVVTRASP